MHKNIFLVITLLISSAFISGCATEKNVPLQNGFLSNNKQKIIVAKAPTPSPVLYKKGPQGLLDMAISNSVTSGFDGYLKKCNLSECDKFQQAFVSKLHTNHVNAKVSPFVVTVDKLPEFKGDVSQYARKNYSTLTSQIPIDADTMLILQVTAIGATRPYYGFIPLGAPQAYCELKGELVNLSNNQVLWRKLSTASTAVEGSWDQPPNYPNFTVAFNNVIKTAQQQLLDDFFQPSDES